MRSRSARSGMRSSRSSPSKPAATSSTCRLPAAALHSSHAPRRRPQVREYRYCRRAVQPAERRSPHALHRLLPTPRHGHGVITRRHHERGLDDAHGRYGGLRVRDGGCDAQAKARDRAREERWSRLAHKFRRIKRALYRARAANAHRDTRVCSLPAENIGNRGNSREERWNKLAELCTWYYRVTGNTVTVPVFRVVHHGGRGGVSRWNSAVRSGRACEPNRRRRCRACPSRSGGYRPSKGQKWQCH